MKQIGQCQDTKVVTKKSGEKKAVILKDVEDFHKSLNNLDHTATSLTKNVGYI